MRWLDMGSQEVYDRLRSEKANPQADVWFGGPDTIFARGAREGLLAAYRPSWADAIAPESRHDGDLYFGLYRTPRDARLQLEGDPGGRGAARLGRPPRPEVEGQDPDPRPARLRHDARGLGLRSSRSPCGRPARPRPASSGSRRLDAQTKEYVFNPIAALREARAPGGPGHDLGPARHAPRAASAARRSQYVFPTSGTPVIDDAVGLVAGSRHADAAKRVRRLPRQQGQQRLAAEKTFRLPARTDIGRELPHGRGRSSARWCRPRSTGSSSRRTAPHWMATWDRTIRGKGAAAAHAVRHCAVSRAGLR